MIRELRCVEVKLRWLLHRLINHDHSVRWDQKVCLAVIYREKIEKRGGFETISKL